MKALQLYFKILDKLSPSLAARKMYTIMTNPRVRKLRDFEEKILNEAKQERISFQGFEIQTYHWGTPKSKTVLLVHGWEGQAGNFGSLVPVLLELGYQVVGYDAPAHGNSSKGKTNMFDIPELTGQFLEKYQPELLISHSFGSVVTAMTLKKHPTVMVKNWIMITTPYIYLNYIKGVSNFFGLSPKTFKKLIRQVEANLGEPIENLNMATYCSSLTNIEQATIIHSIQDKVIPIDSARKTNAGFAKSQLIELDHLGHYGILWSDQTKMIITELLSCS